MKQTNEKIELPDIKEVGPHEYHKQKFNLMQTFRTGSIYIQEKNQRMKQMFTADGYCMWDRGGNNIGWT